MIGAPPRDRNMDYCSATSTANNNFTTGENKKNNNRILAETQRAQRTSKNF
jgi:hypothetical protein